MKKSILILAMLFAFSVSFAKGHQHRRSSYHSRSRGGRFIGGHGSSHRGGQYRSRRGNGEHYSRRKH